MVQCSFLHQIPGQIKYDQMLEVNDLNEESYFNSRMLWTSSFAWQYNIAFCSNNILLLSLEALQIIQTEPYASRLNDKLCKYH